jgi:hypothetical protein
MLNLGDLVDREQFLQYDSFFSPSMRAVSRNVPTVVSRGNHDQSGRIMKSLFTYPDGNIYHSFDYANLHVVNLDACLWRHEESPDETTAMLDWCEEDLRNSKAEWKIVIYHEPSYDMSYRRTNWERERAMKIFRKHGVDAIFVGHAHSYQRFGPLFWPGENDDHPLLHIVASGASNKYQAMPRRADPHLAVRARNSHYMVGSVNGSKLELRAITSDGQEIDRIKLSKKDGQLDPAYVSSAMPAETFEHIEASMRRCVLSKRVIEEGEEFSATFKMTAGSQAYSFRFAPADDCPGVAEVVDDGAGEVPANGAVEATVKFRALKKIEPPERGSRANPLFAVDCHYRRGDRSGVVSSGLATLPK